MTDDKGLINSQEEYDKELLWFNNKVKELSGFKQLSKPFDSYNEFMNILDRAERIGLFDKEFCDSKRKKLIDGIHNLNIKNKLKKALQKRGFIK